MRNILDGYRVFDIDPSKLRSREFYKNMLEYRNYSMRKFSNAIREKSNFKCPLCNRKSAKEFLKYKKYTLLECNFCGLVSPSINFKIIKHNNLYSDKFYKKDTIREIMATYDYRKKIYATERLSYILKKINKLKQKDIRLLDIGCGPGYFISLLQEKGIFCKGLEVTDFLVKICKSKDLNVSNANLKAEKDHNYNIITMYDVIEHVDNPVELLETSHKKLIKGGHVIIYTPYIHSVAYLLMKGQQNTLYPFQHICFFDDNSINFLAKKTGFSVMSIEYFGLDIIDYFCMKSFQDKFDYLKHLKDFIPVIQAILDKQGISNHMRVVLKGG